MIDRVNVEHMVAVEELRPNCVFVSDWSFSVFTLSLGNKISVIVVTLNYVLLCCLCAVRCVSAAVLFVCGTVCICCCAVCVRYGVYLPVNTVQSFTVLYVCGTVCICR